MEHLSIDAWKKAHFRGGIGLSFVFRQLLECATHTITLLKWRIHLVLSIGNMPQKLVNLLWSLYSWPTDLLNICVYYQVRSKRQQRTTNISYLTIHYRRDNGKLFMIFLGCGPRIGKWWKAVGLRLRRRSCLPVRIYGTRVRYTTQTCKICFSTRHMLYTFRVWSVVTRVDVCDFEIDARCRGASDFSLLHLVR